MTVDCLFCRITRRDVNAHIVHEDDRVLAFLVLRPIRPGHTLIIPKDHFDYFNDLPADIATPLFALGQEIATAMKRLFGVERVAFCFTGGDIAHAHAHVVPLHEKTDITSRQYIAEETLTFRDAPPAPAAELARNAANLRQGLTDQLEAHGLRKGK